MIQIVLAILGVSVLLALASLLLPVADRLRLPHTVLLAALGMALGVAALALPDPGAAGILGDVLRGLGEVGLTAEAFLFLFLPPLLFTAGLTIDVRRLLDEFAAVLLLAVVAVLVCIAVVGAVLNWATGLPAVACFLLGAIISTTDPAAVVGIFRDIGAPRRLSILVEGEALLNDAAAIAVFTILVAMLAGTGQASVLGGTLTFLKGFVGGIVLGYVLGRVAGMVLPLLGRARVGQVTLTVSIAYLAFVLGDRYVAVSGVVAVVAAALTLAAVGPARVSPGVWRGLVETWQQLEFWANSLIFVLAAMLAVRVLAALTMQDLVLLALVIVAAMAARAMVLFGLLPGLSALRLVAPIDSRYKIVIMWGGLRGAVTVVLALVAAESPVLPPEMRHFVGVLAILFVMFTLFVCGPTLRPLMRLFGLDRLSPTEVALRDRVIALSRSTVRQQMRQVVSSYGLDPGVVDQAGPAGGAAAEDDPVAGLSQAERVQVGLVTLASHERTLYLRHFDEHIVSRRLMADLLAPVDRMSDLARSGGEAGYSEGARPFVTPDLGMRLALWLNRRFGHSQFLSAQLADHCERLLIVQLVLDELKGFTARSLVPVLGRDTCAALDRVLSGRIQSVQRALAALSLQYGGYAEKIRAQYLTRAALRFEAAEYDRQLREAVLSGEIHADLQRDLARRRQLAERRPPLDLGLELRRMIARVPIFAELDPQAIRWLAERLRPRLALPDERIVARGARGREMYFIAAGEVEVAVRSAPVRLQAGDFFGEMALLSDQPRTADVLAVGYCQLLVLHADDLRRLLRANAGLRQTIEQVAEIRRAANQEELA